MTSDLHGHVKITVILVFLFHFILEDIKLPCNSFLDFVHFADLIFTKSSTREYLGDCKLFVKRNTSKTVILTTTSDPAPKKSIH